MRLLPPPAMKCSSQIRLHHVHHECAPARGSAGALFVAARPRFCTRPRRISSDSSPTAHAPSIPRSRTRSVSCSTSKQLHELLDFARRHDLWVLSDEVYEYFTHGARATREHHEPRPRRSGVQRLPLQDLRDDRRRASATWSPTGACGNHANGAGGPDQLRRDAGPVRRGRRYHRRPPARGRFARKHYRANLEAARKVLLDERASAISARVARSISGWMSPMRVAVMWPPGPSTSCFTIG
jgi:hypothetical protein